MGASELIDNLIEELPDWRGKTFAAVRRAIRRADPEIIEEWKWRGAPVWSHEGIVCVANAFKEKVKLTFYHGVKLADPDKLFNSELAGNQWRSIDYFKDDKVKERELAVLVRSAVEYNLANAKKKTKAPRKKRSGE